MNRDEIIEAGARAWYAHLIGDLTEFAAPWEQLTPPNQDHYKRRAEIHLDAMAPLIRAETAETIAAEIARLKQKSSPVDWINLRVELLNFALDKAAEIAREAGTR